MNANGDRFWRAVEPEYTRARGFCHKLAGNSHDGDDLLQDALIRAMSGFDALRDQTRFRPWFYRIVINTYRNRLRQPWYRRFVPMSDEVSRSAGGDDPSVRHAARRRLEIALAALSPEDRGLVVLFELEGWSLADLSQMHGKSVGSLKVRLHRARDRMRRAIIRKFGQVRSSELVTGDDKVCVATKPAKD